MTYPAGFLFRPDIEADESLESFIDRLAAGNMLSATRTAQLLGILHRGRFPAYWGLLLTDALADSLDKTLGVAARPMTLERYHPTVLDLSGLDPDYPGTLRTVTNRQWMFAAGSRCCAACLATKPYWRLEWKLPWSFVCTAHRAYLTSLCPRCHTRPRSNTPKGTTHPAFGGRVPSPTLCSNQAAGVSSAGRSASACSFDFTTTQPARAPQWAIQAQAEVNRMIGNSNSALAGRTVGRRVSLHTVQAIAVLLWTERDIERRDEPSDEPHHRGHWRTPPRGSQLTAELVAGALTILRAANPHDAAAALLERTTKLIATKAGIARPLHELVTTNDLVEEILDSTRTRTGRPSTMARRAGVQLVLVHGGVDPTDLPQLVTEAHLEPFRQIVNTRHTSSVLRDTVLCDLALLCGAKDLRHAAALIDKPTSNTHRRARYLHGQILRYGRQVEWSEQLRTALRELVTAADPATCSGP